MAHKIPVHAVKKHSKGVSDSRTTQVSNLQTHIQNILGDTHHTFLQGSYKNDTATSDINDVDIVAMRLRTFSSTHSPIQTVSVIPWDSIFTEIEQKLKSDKLYQWTVVRQDKCIEVRTSDFKADVVPAAQVYSDQAEDPVVIYSFKHGTEKVNYPRTHYKNGVEKNRLTNGNYKPVVRMFKNWAANQFGDVDVASSYTIESLVHSSPNDNFSDDHAASFLVVSNHIVDTLSQRDILPVRIMSVCGSEDITSNWDFTSRQLFKTKLNESLLHGLNAYRATTEQQALNHWDKAFNL